MSGKKIVLLDCSQCPHRDHSGAFTPGGAKPMCRYANRELPYTGGLNYCNEPVRCATNVIPDWCPLEDN